MLSRARVLAPQLRGPLRPAPAASRRFASTGPGSEKSSSGLLVGAGLVGLGVWTYLYWLRAVPSARDNAAVRGAAHAEASAALTGLTPAEVALADDVERYADSLPQQSVDGAKALAQRAARRTAALTEAARVEVEAALEGLTPAEAVLAEDYERFQGSRLAPTPKVPKAHPKRDEWVREAARAEYESAMTGMDPAEAAMTDDVERAQAKRAPLTPEDLAKRREAILRAEKEANESGVTSME